MFPQTKSEQIITRLDEKIRAASNGVSAADYDKARESFSMANNLKRADALLQNGDVIYIGPIGSQVAVLGSVNNEAIFEARATDTLTDVLLYAGGVSTVADDTRLLVLDSLTRYAMAAREVGLAAGEPRTVGRGAVLSFRSHLRGRSLG